MLNTLIIDNFDSFTYNIFQFMGEVCGEEPTVIVNTTPINDIDFNKYDCIIISPGPGKPGCAADVGISADIIRRTSLPLLGVCLGHQCVAHLHGMEVVHAPEPVHGRISLINHHGQGLFTGLPQSLAVVRYHSLVVNNIKSPFEITAWDETGMIHAIQHKQRPVYGVQFHPESICSESGLDLLRNFRDIAVADKKQRVKTFQIKDIQIKKISDTTPAVISALTDKHHLKIVTRTLDIFPEILTTFQTEFQHNSNAFFLESSVIMPGFSRFSFMGESSGALAEIITYHISEKKVTIKKTYTTESVQVSSIFAFLEQRIKQKSISSSDELPFDFNLGYVGFLGYELKAETIGESAHQSANDDTHCVNTKNYDAIFILATKLIVFDHLENKCYLLYLSDNDTTPDEEKNWFDAVEHRMKTVSSHVQSDISDNPACHERMSLQEVELWIKHNAIMRHDKAQYLKKIDESLKKIVDGESYEICLTNNITFKCEHSPFELYRKMRQLTPAPHAAYFNVDHFYLISSSPERLLQIDKHHYAETKPIKGTRSRGKDPDDDLSIIAELKNSGKDRAENLMIVDLLRNDLGQVCSVGSVNVPTLFAVESYSHVHQLVSTVNGQLKPDISAVACVRALFPGGSMTGAPKKRTMSIIDELEQGARGVYSGAFGWFSLSGACDLSIIIRTLAIDHGYAHFGVGGALTALSDPEEEFNETMIKARGVIEVIESVK